ncbi:MAG: tRNA lysidine(34) synthetase TilS, partial [Chloroflexi bacterium]|nr:tRNA lysidine(34) synthetase TilS [Chloroflexota bacterium]
ASAPIPAEQARAALQTAPPGPWEVWLDPDAAPPPWEVAPPRPGERFAPLGMHGHSLTVGDAFTNRKIPLSARERWPLVRDAHGRVAWFPGYGPAHHARLTPASRRAVHLYFIPPAEQGHELVSPTQTP